MSNISHFFQHEDPCFISGTEALTDQYPQVNMSRISDEELLKIKAEREAGALEHRRRRCAALAIDLAEEILLQKPVLIDEALTIASNFVKASEEFMRDFTMPIPKSE